MTAVHGMFGTGGLLSVVMPMNWTLAARGATGTGVKKPGGSAHGRVEKDDRNETERCDNRAAALLIQKSHFLASLLKSYAKSALIDQTRLTRLGKLQRYSPMGELLPGDAQS